jgi:opacity protein-like surface antigen
MELPEGTLYSRNQAISNALDIYEYNMNIKGTVDIEIVTEREIDSVDPDTSAAKLEGYSAMVKLSNNFHNVLEPYIKIGSSSYEVKWRQHNKDVTVESQPGLTWGVGTKVKLWEFENIATKLTLDVQHRESDLDVDTAQLNGSATTASAASKKLEIKDLQLTLLASKKITMYGATQDYFIVPYAGMTFTDADINVKFTQTTTGALYSTYNASNKNKLGAVLGFDIMPSLLSWYLLSLELRLVNETAFTLSGTVRF